VLENGYKLVGGVLTGGVGGSTGLNGLVLSGAVGAVTLDFDKAGAGFANFGTVAFGAAGGNDETLAISNTTGTPGATITGFGTVNDIIDLTAIGTDGTIASQSSTEVTVTGSNGTVTFAAGLRQRHGFHDGFRRHVRY
jgi:hypothetical protein